MNFLIAAETDRGNIKPTNQDSLLVQSISTAQGGITLAVLCDGMGGLQKGEDASSTLIHGFKVWAEKRLSVLCERTLNLQAIAQDWDVIVQRCNLRLKAYGAEQNLKLGTTVTALLLTNSGYLIMNVGDSRCYQITDRLLQLTKDQTVVQREVDNGIITQEQAENDRRRSILLQCVGASEVVVPEFFYGSVCLNAVYMLCSDGFRHVISPEEIFAALNPQTNLNEEGMHQNLRSLIDLNKQRGERDNISALTIRTY